MEGKIPEAPFSKGEKVWIRSCTSDMGLPRKKHVVASIFYDKDEWRLRVKVGSLESYPACYFQNTEPTEEPGEPAYIGLVQRNKEGSD